MIFAEPEHAEARALQADTLEQMGYQAESAVWRNFYLQGARELRHGVLPMGSLKLSNPDVAKSMTLDMLLDLVGVRLDAGRLGDARAVIAIEIPERDEARTLWFENRAIHHRPGMSSDATITVTRSRRSHDHRRSRPGDRIVVVPRRVRAWMGSRHPLTNATTPSHYGLPLASTIPRSSARRSRRTLPVDVVGMASTLNQRLGRL